MVSKKSVNPRRPTNAQGFSLLELIIVIAVMAVMVATSMLLFGNKQRYPADDQAYIVMDFLKEARQRAITQLEIMRVEINQDRRTISLINENLPGDVSDDKEIRTATFAKANLVVFDSVPNNIAGNPVEPTPVPVINFKTSVYPTSQSEKVATLRFMKNGNVMDAGSNAIGNNAAVTGATLFFWMPEKKADGSLSTNGSVIRAVTLLGTSGNVRYWKCAIISGQCSGWSN